MATLFAMGDALASAGFYADMALTLGRVLVAFTAASVVGCALGIAVGLSRRTEAFFQPLLAVGLAIPDPVYIIFCHPRPWDGGVGRRRRPDRRARTVRLQYRPLQRACPGPRSRRDGQGVQVLAMGGIPVQPGAPVDPGLSDGGALLVRPFVEACRGRRGAEANRTASERQSFRRSMFSECGRCLLSPSCSPSSCSFLSAASSNGSSRDFCSGDCDLQAIVEPPGLGASSSRSFQTHFAPIAEGRTVPVFRSATVDRQHHRREFSKLSRIFSRCFSMLRAARSCCTSKWRMISKCVCGPVDRIGSSGRSIPALATEAGRHVVIRRAGAAAGVSGTGRGHRDP